MADQQKVPFADRLALAEYVHNSPPTIPDHLYDQLLAASHELRDRCKPALDYFLRSEGMEAEMTAEALQRLIAAGMDSKCCPHVRLDAPQPLMVVLPLKRMDCLRCARTFRKPPPEDADRCDICGSRGNDSFTEFMVQVGPLFYVGSAASCCRAVLVHATKGT